MRIVLIGCAIVLATIAVAFIVAMIYMRTYGKELMASAKTARTDGLKFGQNASDSQCLDAAMARYKGTRGMAAGIREGVFLNACFETSAVDPQFCTSVPAQTEFLRSARWKPQRCAEFGLRNDVICPSLLEHAQAYCYGPVRRRKTDATAAPLPRSR